jgi:hypothetical protein
VFECVTTQQKNAKVVVILVTYGGSANVAYRTGRFLQTLYDEVVVSSLRLCKSAGTQGGFSASGAKAELSAPGAFVILIADIWLGRA